MQRGLILLLPVIMLSGCKHEVYVSQCKWAKEIRAASPFKEALIEFVDGSSDAEVRYQGRMWLNEVAIHNQNVARFCY